jgi:hypothetical protein
MASINISGYEVLVDEEDFDRICAKHWYMNQSICRKHGLHYFVNDVIVSKKKISTYLHRFILKLSSNDKVVVDHINGDTLDCRKQNLRICTCQENTRNQKVSARSSSKYKGVQWCKAACKWQARIVPGNIGIYLGLYSDPKEAATVYDVAALYYFGEFARLNFNKDLYKEVNLESFVKSYISKFTSKYIGVHENNGKWIAAFTHNKNRYYLGSFATEIEAAIARDKKARELAGDLVRLNFPIDSISKA